MNFSGKGDWKVRKGIAEGGFEMENPWRILGVGTVKGERKEMRKQRRETRIRLYKDLVVGKK